MNLLGLRRDDGRTVWMAFATLLMIVAAHAVLETARDALFLADLPVTRLPWAYLGIAGLAFVAGRGSERLLTGRSARRVLAATLFVGAMGTLCFWRVVATPTAASLMALYIWTGLLASVVVPQFWVRLGSAMDVTQAKRAYAIVAAGGMLGATIGSFVAGVALTFEGPRALLPLAAAMFVLAACLPAFAPEQTDVPEPRAAAPPPQDDERPRLRAAWGDPYLRRILCLAVAGPVVAMGIDFVFKSIVTREVPRADLGPFFARFNTIVNAAALIFQVTLAPRLLQSFGVVRNLCLLPGSLALVAAGVAGTAAFPAALVLRGTDGILRHSLHRAAAEILFLPLSTVTRSVLRGLAESIGQRGGQVAGSLLILTAIALGATPRDLAAGVAVLCVVWLVGYLRLQTHYVERFRSQLRASSVSSDAAVPDLDLQSLETLVAALSAPNDAEVIAALDLLANYGRIRLVSPLILYHPSSRVVVRALELFEGIRRDDLQAIRRRLLEHHEPAVRAAVLRQLVSGGSERSVVRTMLRQDPSPLVRSTALVIWMGSDDAPESDLDEAVADLVALPDVESRLAVASTLGELPARLLLPVSRALLADPTPAVRRQVARTLATDPDERRTAVLTELVAIPECRAFARAGLCALGPRALDHVARALENVGTPGVQRRHLPRTISCFGSGRAVEILVAQLAREEDSRVIYKILRGLGRLRADDPSLPLDRPTLVRVAEKTLERTIELLAYHVAADLVREIGTPATDLHGPPPASAERLDDEPDLLGALIAEMEERALERVFRVLQILETSEEFAVMFAALSDDAHATRANAREVIGHVLDGRFRDALLALTDSLPPAERLLAAAGAVPVPVAETTLAAWRIWTKSAAAASVAETLSGVVEVMLSDRSTTLSSVARYQLPPRVAGLSSPTENPRVAS